MQTNSHQGPFPDRSTEQTTPPMQTVSDESHEPPSVNQEAVTEQTWVPRFDRRQSWSQEDRKHQMQERLMEEVEQGRESGFSENEH
jgi:hypothetical protein